MLCFVKSVEESFSAVSVVSSNPAIGPFQLIKILFCFLFTWTEELIPPPKTITFLPNPLPLDNVNVHLIFMSKCQNNPIKEQSDNPLGLHAEI